ncbi:hypothetical protein DH2020_023626 [Rehmannia glutinosa]|uniref:FLZ-type domain-containing protein n=1 Tax=Rehmannia glutinosa TaxID=99300 RepID=A0ABR0W6J9_REHGL
MTEFTLDFNGVNAEGVYQPLDPHNPFNGLDPRFSGSATVASRKPHRRNSADFVETANFLRVCSFSKGRLIPAHDIYMYRIN